VSTTSTQLNRIRQRLDDLDLAVGTFARACGFSPSALSQAMRGSMNLTGESEAALATASARLTEIAVAIRPLSLPPNADDLRVILEHVAAYPDSIGELGASINKVFNSSGSQSSM